MAAAFRKRWGLTWDIHGDGKTINAGQVVKPHERMAWPQTIGIGLQHVMAMFGSTVLVPALTGFPPTAALFFSGVGTLLFLVITKGKVPSYLGSSFAFIAPMVAATSMHSMAVASGGIILTGLALAIVGFIVHKAGTRWIHAVMPPVVMGTILALIGLNLAGATTEGMVEVPLTTFGTTVAVIITAVLFRGFLGRLSILLPLGAGPTADRLPTGRRGFLDWAPGISRPGISVRCAVLILAGGLRAGRRKHWPRSHGGPHDAQ